jgi:hypothetical protein
MNKFKVYQISKNRLGYIIYPKCIWWAYLGQKYTCTTLVKISVGRVFFSLDINQVLDQYMHICLPVLLFQKLRS